MRQKKKKAEEKKSGGWFSSFWGSSKKSKKEEEQSGQSSVFCFILQPIGNKCQWYHDTSLYCLSEQHVDIEARLVVKNVYIHSFPVVNLPLNGFLIVLQKF